jgi:predicted DNA-binding transcriptional regulator AlpA
MYTIITLRRLRFARRIAREMVMRPTDPHPVQPKELLTAGEVAARLSMSTRTLYRLVAAREFPQPVRRGRKWVRWRAGDIQRFLDTLGTAS